jgi:integrase
VARVFKRRDGKVWYGWFYELNGKRRQKSTKCTDQRAAERVQAGWERDAADPDSARKASATIGDALNLVVERAAKLARTGRRSLATLSFYEAKVATLRRRLALDAPERLADLRARHVDDFVDHRREEKVSDSAIRKELGALGLGLKLARRAGLWSGSPDEVLPVLPDTGYVPRERWLPVAEVQKLLAELVGDRGARVAFIVATSARWSESERAERADVDLARGIVLVRGTKTKLSLREVPVIVEEMRSLLRLALERAEGTSTLFAPWPNARRDLRAACARAGIAPCSPNDLRRTFTHWHEAVGLPPNLVAPAMGHADSRMVERVYGRMKGDELARVMRAAAHVQQTRRTRADSMDSADKPGGKTKRQTPVISVPRDGIEPPTRGFSTPARLWPLPKQDNQLRARARRDAAHVQQLKRRGGP